MEIATPLRSLEEMLALGIDDCGLPLDGHPELPPINGWADGRPCGKAFQSPMARQNRGTNGASARWNGSVTPRAEIVPFR